MLREVCTPRTRAIIVNTPWNPLGRAFSAEEWAAVATVAAEHDASVVSDEAYDHCVLDGGRHAGVLASAVPEDRRIKVGSFSKSLCATGWRVGYIVASAETSRRIRTVHQFSSFCANSVVQEAVREVLAGPFAQIRREVNERFADNVEVFASALEGHGFAVTRPTHGFFVLADVGEHGQDWVERMLANGGVAGLPVATFCGDAPGAWDSVIRFALCKRPETIQEAATRLAARLP
ncbi:tetraspanin-1 [Platysternon megacephalum]|uniref:Tetraspanin-1 n=1 Tax=Platysternon megacephalum TaxID=55544 RepID=A0A4D9DEI9_9SAUR|nr:tetraspanin-1 [Platysternon megacephalum]